jgi:hypothetical protein
MWRNAHGARLSALKAVSRFEFASVHSGLFGIRVTPDRTRGPTQIEFRAERKNHGNAVDVGLKTYSFLRGRKGEVECLAKDNRI